MVYIVIFLGIIIAALQIAGKPLKINMTIDHKYPTPSLQAVPDEDDPKNPDEKAPSTTDLISAINEMMYPNTGGER